MRFVNNLLLPYKKEMKLAKVCYKKEAKEYEEGGEEEEQEDVGEHADIHMPGVGRHLS